MKKREIIKILKSGGVGVMPTDTVYGLAGSALQPETVTRIHKLKRRAEKKPFIILISEISDLNKFGLKISKKLQRQLRQFWPGPVSIILPYRRKTLAFRLPKPLWLRKLLKQTGPLIATSANIAGQLPAENIKQAKKYFGKKIDFYLAGKVRQTPSTLIKLDLMRGKVAVLRGRLK